MKGALREEQGLVATRTRSRSDNRTRVVIHYAHAASLPSPTGEGLQRTDISATRKASTSLKGRWHTRFTEYDGRVVKASFPTRGIGYTLLLRQPYRLVRCSLTIHLPLHRGGIVFTPLGFATLPPGGRLIRKQQCFAFRFCQSSFHSD